MKKVESSDTPSPVCIDSGLYRLAIQLLSSLQVVYYFTDVSEDAVEVAQTVDVVMYALIGVPVYQRGGLVVIDGEALLDSLFVVIAAAALLSAQEEALHEFLFGHVELYHGSHLVPACGEHVFQGLGLGNGTGKSVEDYSLVLLAEAVVHAGQNVDHQCVGYELPLIYETLGRLAKFRTVLDLIAEHVSCGDVAQRILGDHLVTLCALAGTGRTENHNILHSSTKV